jgi:DNA-binding winged helix-turn-helix (wHTH) protein
MSATKDEVFTFGEFTLIPRERLIERGQKRISLTPKAFDLLVALVRRSGRLVTRDDLVRELWPSASVEEQNNLYVQISTVRKALDLGRNGNGIIETVGTRGYRFVAPVTRGDVKAR